MNSNNNFYLIGLLDKLNELINVKHLETVSMLVISQCIFIQFYLKTGFEACHLSSYNESFKKAKKKKKLEKYPFSI